MRANCEEISFIQLGISSKRTKQVSIYVHYFEAANIWSITPPTSVCPCVDSKKTCENVVNMTYLFGKHKLASV
jgi:hypothetical protein